MCTWLKLIITSLSSFSQLQTSLLFSDDLSLRNEWCIAPEASKGCFLQSWFLVAKVERFSGMEGSLLDNPELWQRVPNDAFFFSAIRSAWTAYTTLQPSWDSQPTPIMREDPNISQLRGLSLGVFIIATPTMALPLMQSRNLDVTARARSAGHLADWQREGDIVVGWIEQLKTQGRPQRLETWELTSGCTGRQSASASTYSTDQPLQPRRQLRSTPYNSGSLPTAPQPPAAYAARWAKSVLL